jgi:amidase
VQITISSFPFIFEKSSRMKRRHFLFSSAAAAGIGMVQGLQSCLPKNNSVEEAGSQAAMSLPEYSVSALAKMFRSGELTPRTLAELYLERIRAIDKSGPALNSVIELNPDALEEADRAGKELKEGNDRGPLHGIPLLIKDNIDTADKMHTTAGSLALANSIALHDAGIVDKLRKAGAIILGKTNLSEWANIRSSHSSSGWSARGGQTSNPYYLDCNPCGSSSGSGVAVTSNLCTLAIGTETDGSIVCPSSTNGIVGIKPTVGLWSRAGIVPISHTQDTAGPMARSVADAAALLGICMGPDERDAATKACPFEGNTDFTKYLDPRGLKAARIGVDRNSFGFSAAVDKVMEEAIRVMKDLGAEIIDPAPLNLPREAGDAEMEILMCEFKTDLNTYLAGCSPDVKVRSLEDLIRFNEENKEKEMPWFGQELFYLAESKGSLEDPKYLKALADSLRFSRQEGIDKTMNTHNLDAIIAPTGGPAWKTDWVNGDHFSGGSSSASACAGYPAITVPAGNIHGLPVGITFMGKAWSEPRLISIAFAYEQASKARISPAFKAEMEK